MDSEGFRKYLKGRELPDETVEASIAIVGEFEQFLVVKRGGRNIAAAGVEDADAFIVDMISRGVNTHENFAALLRYGYFIKNNDLYISFLEPIDGGNVLEVLHEKLGEQVGKGLRDEVFEGIDLPPLGTRPSDKPKFAQAVMERMESMIDPDTCEKTLVDVAHGLPKQFYDSGQRDKFLAAKDLDKYLEQERADFIAMLEKHRDEGTPFFNQEITDEVVQWIRDNPGIGAEKREGEYIVHTKIPFLAKDYLTATDERMKRYYACHCGWARESIKSGDEVSATFCNCSAGFTVKPWEIAFDQPLQVEMLESVLQGDLRCTFRIPIPKEIMEGLD